MTHEFWRGFLNGVTVANVLWAGINFYTSYRLNTQKCETCGKKYHKRKSTCKEYPFIFCSEPCKQADMLESLIKQGVSPGSGPGNFWDSRRANHE